MSIGYLFIFLSVNQNKAHVGKLSKDDVSNGVKSQLIFHKAKNFCAFGLAYKTTCILVALYSQLLPIGHLAITETLLLQTKVEVPAKNL